MLVKLSVQKANPPASDGVATYSPSIRLVRESLILSIEAHPQDSARTIVRLAQGETPGTLGQTNVVMNESVTQYAARYAAAATAGSDYIDLDPAQTAPPVAGGKLHAAEAAPAQV